MKNGIKGNINPRVSVAYYCHSVPHIVIYEIPSSKFEGISIKGKKV